MDLSWLLLILFYGVLAQAKTSSRLSAGSNLFENGSCRYLSGDSSWPGWDVWAELNSTVGGRLIQTIPLAAVCHDPVYNQDECDDLQRVWSTPTLHESSPSSFMMPWLQNHSCDPFTSNTQPCQLGNYVSYSINISSASDVIAGLQFAEQNNIRPVIKNTGHDYLGKSTGKGGLGIWMHSLNASIFIENYESSYYTGPAFRFGAGILAYEAYIAADAKGYRVIGGECPTVGIVGGYTQGGGHSMLSSLYGLGADQTLEWEVVTAQGQHLKATPNENSDLYWALSGGGGGTFGVVLSMTVRAHRDSVVGGASLSLPLATLSNDTFWAAVAHFHAGIAPLVDAGISIIYSVFSDSFNVISLTSPNATATKVRSQLEYFTHYLDDHNVSYTLNTTSFSRYLDHVIHYFGPLPDGDVPASSLIGSRLIPRSTVQADRSDSNLTNALKRIVATPPFYAVGVAVNVSDKNTIAANAVLPAWRDALIHMTIIGPWDYTGSTQELAAFEDTLTNELNPVLDAVAPDSGTYVNEANFQLGSWKESFYGLNYGELRDVKRRYDPKNLLYATKAVGSEEWTVDGEGRLCRA